MEIYKLFVHIEHATLVSTNQNNKSECEFILFPDDFIIVETEPETIGLSEYFKTLNAILLVNSEFGASYIPIRIMKGELNKICGNVEMVGKPNLLFQVGEIETFEDQD